MTTQQDLDDRYGRARRPLRRRAFWVAVGAAGAASVLALSWFTFANTLDDVGFDETGYEVIDERTVTLSFQATPPSGVTFACALQALDEDFGVVGWRVVEYPGSDTVTRTLAETIPTVGLATTGTVHSCWAT